MCSKIFNIILNIIMINFVTFDFTKRIEAKPKVVDDILEGILFFSDSTF